MVRLVSLLVLVAASVLPQTIAIEHASVVDPATGRIQTDQTILVEPARVRVVPSRLRVPAGTRRIEARGKFAIPCTWATELEWCSAAKHQSTNPLMN